MIGDIIGQCELEIHAYIIIDRINYTLPDPIVVKVTNRSKHLQVSYLEHDIIPEGRWVIDLDVMIQGCLYIKIDTRPKLKLYRRPMCQRLIRRLLKIPLMRVVNVIKSTNNIWTWIRNIHCIQSTINVIYY